MPEWEFQKRRRRFSWIVFILLLIVIGLAVTHSGGWLGRLFKSAGVNQPGLYKVVKFDDGDTIVVDMNGANETIRFIGVDTPETHKPNTPIQCYGWKAADFTEQFIGSQRVRLQSDPLDTNRDRYGRLLRYVYLPDGTLVDKVLIQKGYGFAYTSFPFTKSIEFKAAELKAEQSKTGLWGACKVIRNQYGGHNTTAASQR